LSPYGDERLTYTFSNRGTDKKKKNNDPQNITQKFTEPTTNRESKLGCSGRVYILLFSYHQAAPLLGLYCANYHNSRPLFDEMMCIEKRALL
jgi:hypothetical protein